MKGPSLGVEHSVDMSRHDTILGHDGTDRWIGQMEWPSSAPPVLAQWARQPYPILTPIAAEGLGLSRA